MSDINYREYGLGCKISGYDPRDYIYDASPDCATTYPISFQLEKFPIKNQQTVNSCCANSVALMAEIMEYYDTGIKKEFSVGWLYGYRLATHYKGPGMYNKECLETMLKVGDVYVNEFPEDLEYSELSKLISQKKTKCIVEANKHKIKSYAKVNTSAAVKKSLYEDKTPVLLSIDVYESFYDIDGSGKYDNVGYNNTGYGHAMVIVGWTEINGTGYYVVQNSWGEQWGKNGYCYIPYSSRCISEMYTCIDIRNIDKKFSDVTGGKHWGEEAIDKCVRAGLIDGYPDGTFKPNNTITRAEICTMFARMLKK